MHGSPYPSPEHADSHLRHKRKRKTRRKLIQRIIIVGLFLLVCAGAMTAWHILVDDPPRRTAVASALARS